MTERSWAYCTYINLTENNVYYAANHNQGVKHIPGIPKVALIEVERGVGELGLRSAKTKRSLHWNLNPLTLVIDNTQGPPCWLLQLEASWL